MRRTALIVATLLTAGSTLQSALYRMPLAEDLVRIDEFVRAEVARQKIPGVAAAVILRGNVVKAGGYGKANVEHDVPVTPDTIFQSGSVGKQFTAAAVMLMVEDGKLALDDPVSKYFSGAPADWNTITVRHLLTHTSGLPDYTSGTIDFRRDYTEDDLVQFAYALTPEFPPGTRWNYSNTGYVLLGILVHKASGKFYGDVLRERVFQPLGMRSARVITEEDIVPHRAAGYRLAGGELKNQSWVAPQINTTADGSLYVSLRDMIAWDRGLRENRVLKPESWAAVFAPVALASGKTYPYGFGWAFEEIGGHRGQRHGGSWQGFKTHILRYPEDELSVIVLANLAQADPEVIADGIAALVDPTMKRPELAPIDDTWPDVTSRVRQLLHDTAAGQLKPADFAYMRAGFFPEGAKRYAELLRKAGGLRSLTLLERRELGDDAIYTYDVTAAAARLRLRVGIAPDGRIAVFSLSPQQPQP